MGIISNMSDARKSPEFLALQAEAKEALEKMDEVMEKLNKQFPLKDGFWTIRAGGIFGVSFYYPND